MNESQKVYTCERCGRRITEEEYESVAEKLVDLGFMDEALRIHETIKELSGRKRTLIEAKIQLLKNKNRGKEGKPDG